MPNLSDEDECMLSLIQIAGFPVEIKHGLFTWNEAEAGFPPRMGMPYRAHSTADINEVVKIFEFWKKHHGKN
jgi:hypothetical protein